MTTEHEAILERLMRLDVNACVRMRPMHRGQSRWYVDSGRVVLAHPNHTGWNAFFENGSTPEFALERTWASILAHCAEGQFFLKYSCPSRVPIPSDDSQVWVRWSEEKDDWVDVEPTAEMLQLRGIPADRIHRYQRSEATVCPR